MREMIRGFLAVLVILSVVAGCATRTPEVMYQAVGGEEIVVEHYFVSPEQKVDFEMFVMEVLKPAFEEARPKANARVRFWLDTEVTDDSTFHYAFVIDPYEERYNYDVEAVLKAAYGEERGEGYQEQFEGYLTDSSTSEYQQTEW